MEAASRSLARWTRRRLALAALRTIERPLMSVARRIMSSHVVWSQRTQATAWYGIDKLWFALGLIFFAPGVWLGSRAALLSFVPRASDIFIVTYPKSGTNWMQMIMYQLTTDGDMKRMTHLLDVSPWIEAPFGRTRDLEEYPPCRIIKSHLSYKRIPKGPGKYIYIMRDGKDVVVSHYYQNRRIPFGASTFPRFFERWMRGWVDSGSWFEHVAGWWSHRDDPNVLFLHYEDLQRDLQGAVRRIAKFCDIALDHERLARTLERSSFAFMKQYEDKIDPMPFMGRSMGAMLPQFGEATFLRKGTTGDWKAHLTPEQRARFDRRFAQTLAPLGIMQAS